MYEILISTHFLPRMVVLACLLAILIETSWNVQTAMDLTARNIINRGSKFFIVGVKSRTDTLQDAEIHIAASPTRRADSVSSPQFPDIEIKDRTAIRAIKLLLANNEAIEREHNVSDSPLFTVIHRKSVGPIEFRLLPTEWALRKFFKRFPYQRFQYGALRKLGAHIDYLSEGGNLFTTQALLHHASPEVTKIYLESTLFAELLEANTRRFMRKMEATTLFVCGRGQKLTERGLSEKDVQPMLFPATPSINSSSVADEWIEGSISTFKVGLSELEHCAYQHHFYKKNYQKLVEENPIRFMNVHAPRLLFCIALRNVILASPHKRLLTQYEKKMK